MCFDGNSYCALLMLWFWSFYFALSFIVRVNADGYVNRSAQLLLKGRQNHIVPDVLWLMHKWQIRYTNAFICVFRIVAIHSTIHGKLKCKLTYDMPMVQYHFTLYIFVAMKMVYSIYIIQIHASVRVCVSVREKCGSLCKHNGHI